MNYRKLRISKNDYGWLPTSWDSLTKRVDGFGKLVAMLTNIQRNAAFWKSKGVLPGVPGGTTANAPGYPEYAGLQVEEISRFVGAGALEAGTDPANPNRLITDWIQHNADLLAFWWSTYRKAKVVVESIDEDYTGKGSVSSIFHRDLFYMVCVALGKAYKALGIIYCMTYAGVCYITKATNPSFDNCEDYIGSLDNEQTALTNLRPGGLHNHRSTPVWDADTPEKPNMFRWCHALVNCYFAAASMNGNPNARLAEFVCNMIITRNGLIALGYTTAVKICSFFWFTNAEFSNYQLRVNRPVPAGGNVLSDNFPNYSFKWQLAGVLYAKILTEIIFGWDNEIAFGGNRNKVPFDTTEPNTDLIRYEGSGATRANRVASTYLDDQPEMCYPIKPLGFDNALPEGCLLYDTLCNWTGNATFAIAPTRKTGQTTWSSTLRSSIVRQFKVKELHCYFTKSGNGNRGLFMYSYAETEQSYEIDIDGATMTVVVQPYTPTCYIAKV